MAVLDPFHQAQGQGQGQGQGPGACPSVSACLVPVVSSLSPAPWMAVATISRPNFATTATDDDITLAPLPDRGRLVTVMGLDPPRLIKVRALTPEAKLEVDLNTRDFAGALELCSRCGNAQ